MRAHLYDGLFAFCVADIAIRSYTLGTWFERLGCMQVRFAFHKVLAYLGCWLMCLSLPAISGGSLRFEHLALTGEVADKNDNLSAVRATVKDKHGFMWFGGENGLGRYDSQDLIIYQTDADNPKSLSANFIWSLAIDHDGVLWIGTGRGLNRYNILTNDFDRYAADASTQNSIANNNINALTVDQQNNLIIGTGNGLSILNPQRTHFRNYYPQPDGDNKSTQNLIREVFVDKQNKIWVGTAKNGLNLFDRKTEKFLSFLHNAEDPVSLSSNDIAAIEEDEKGNLWVGTYSQGLNRMNADGQTFTRYKHNPADKTSLASNNITDILEDKYNNLWVATDHGGLNRYQPEADVFLRFKHSAYDANSLSSDNPRKLYEDDQGNLWIGMFPTGVTFLDQSTAIFSNYFHKPDAGNSLSSGGVLCFFQDSEGVLWIGTENGLNAFDREKNMFTHYFGNDADGLNLGAVLTIEEDANGDLWLGTWSGGLHRFSKKTGEVRSYLPVENDPNGLNDAFVWKVLRDKNNTIWLATENGGINKYNPASDSFIHYTAKPSDPDAIISNQIWTIMEDRHEQIWVATLEGLDRLDKKTEKFTHFLHNSKDSNTISSNQIVSLFEDSRGKIWIGTRDAGVNIYNPLTNTFSSLNVRDGLPSATISSIIEDARGDIWVTTVNGIARIEPGTLAIKSFNKSHGLVSNNFNRDATFKDQKGQLYVGSIGGFSVFDPSKIIQESTPPPVVLTHFRILNRSVIIGGDDGLLQQSITDTKKLTLNYKHTMFSFDFAALSYRSPSNNKYAYMLEGFDHDWHHIGNQRTATYTNINPGRYTFKVKAANTDGIWNDDGVTLLLDITPPLWQTWWAYFGYAFLFGAVMFMINKYKNLSIKANVYRILSATDPLTGVYNRAGMEQVVSEIFASREIRTGVCLLVFDVDHFKKINDLRGHDAGDRVLKDLTSLITRNIRLGDSFCRWGGEEFVLLCVNSTRDGVLILAEKIRRVIEEHVFEKEHFPLKLTVSIGISCSTAEDSFETLFKRADLGLYEAKESGRNRVVVRDPSA